MIQAGSVNFCQQAFQTACFDVSFFAISARAGIEACPYETLPRKKFPTFHILDSRLRGNDGIQSIAALKMKQAGYDGTTAVENQYRLRFFRRPVTALRPSEK